MSPNSIVKFCFSFCIVIIVILSCKKKDPEPLEFPTPPTHEVQIESEWLYLNWYPSTDETQSTIESGLKWCFSYLGATLPTGSMKKALIWQNDQKIRLNILELGFNEQAELTLRRIVSTIKNNEDYQIKGGIDLGRLVVTIFNNSNHYYEIVNMPKTLDEFDGQQIYSTKKAGIEESLVSFANRVLLFPENLSSETKKFKSLEVEGSIRSENVKIKEFEVFDFMPNGQPRFGIYDLEGKIINGADTKLTSAGKPAKCHWCHESTVSRPFVSTTNVPGYYTIAQFDSLTEEAMKYVNESRSKLNSDLDFGNTSEHTQFDKIYIRFLEPSLKRLASEYAISEEEAFNRFKSLPTHRSAEFPDMGELYSRKQIDLLSAVELIPISKNARDTELNEPNLLK